VYRRNISNILYPLAGIIGLVVAYQALVRPNYIQTSPPAAIEPESPVDTRAQVADTAYEPPPEESRVPAQKQLRLIDAGGVPDTGHHRILEAIRDEIEKGNLKTAEGQLMNLPAGLQANSQTGSYVAILWNNLGIEQEKLEGTKSSITAFKKAASLDPQNPVIQLNLAHAYWEQRDPAMNQDFLERLIALAPQEPFPHVALADLLQEGGRVSEAARHLEQANERAAADPSMQSYLRTVTSKVQRMDQVESRLTRREGAHFTVKYDGETDPDSWAVVLEILEEAYREIGQKFGHFPAKPVVVVLHSNATFQANTGSPAWADGLFDPVLGRIHLPTQGALTDRTWLKRVLRHEFVHALLHDQQGVSHNALPTWLNEGLAMQLSSDHWPDVEQLRRDEVSLIPLTALEGSWGDLSSEAASIAYLEADSATRYLVHRYGMHEVQQLLIRLRKRQSLASAMQAELSMSYDQFQSRWMTDLREGRTKNS
jgi:tetratricopeptide (TPR) repeat protein